MYVSQIKERKLVQFIIEEQNNVRLDPILNAVRKSHYLYLTELRVWDIPLKHPTVADIVRVLLQDTVKVINTCVCDKRFYCCYLQPSYYYAVTFQFYSKRLNGI